jgi:hypothetical protein
MRAHFQRITERRRPRRDRPRGHLAPSRPAPADAPTEPERRVREAGGPEDVATYTCSCGFHFEAPVSTSVACPHCGSGQAW